MEDTLKSGIDDLVLYLTEKYKDWDGVNQLQGTPERLFKMYQEFCWSPERIRTELDSQFRLFENGYDQMLVRGPITVWVLCPHHLLPVSLRVTIGYVPSGRVLGLSKFTRIAQVMGHRPIMQEQYSTELTDELYKRLDPKGVAVYIAGRHGCMLSRGILEDSQVVTSNIRGVFESQPETRAEFFAICRG